MSDPLLSPEEIAALTGVFQAQAAELLEDYSRLVLELETAEDASPALRHIKRIVHTLKGDSMALDFDEVAKIAHQLEDLLGDSEIATLIKNRSNTSNFVDVLLRSGDTIGRLIDKYAQAGAASETPATPSATELLEELLQFRHLAEPTLEARTLEILITFAEECTMRSAGSFLILQRLEPIGDVLREIPDSNSKEIESAPKWRIQLLTSEAKESIRAAVRVPGVVKRVRIQDLSDKALSAEERPEFESVPVSEDTDTLEQPQNDAVVESSVVERQEDKSKAVDYLRVEVPKIDRIMNLVGELVLARSMLFDGLQSRGFNGTGGGGNERIYEASQLFDSTLTELQAAVLQTRMVPVDQVFRRFPRIVREVTRISNKQVELTVEGTNTELDKSIADRIGEPLLHLIRNAIDHGIETPEDRLRAGKPSTGSLRLSASCEANQVHIEVSDDGRGIDIDLLAERALLNKLVTSAELEAMTPNQKLELIYHSGFSTKAEVSTLSGRGIGMDVAKSMVESLNGEIDCVTQTGMGTRFVIRLPLTLSIARALLVKVSHHALAIPLTAVTEIVRIDQEERQSVLGRAVLNLRGDVIPLIDLAKALSLTSSLETMNRSLVLIVGDGERRVGLVVDEVRGEHELVVKPFEDPLVKSPGIAGASVMGNGSIVLIVDVRGLLNARRETVGVAG